MLFLWLSSFKQGKNIILKINPKATQFGFLPSTTSQSEPFDVCSNQNVVSIISQSNIDVFSF